MTKRKFTKEFKLQAIELASSLGNISQAARQLGVLESNIHGWKRQLSKVEKIDKTPALSASEAEELKRLRRETAEQKKVIHILKAAAAFFSQDHLK
jgi:transposase